MGGDAGTGKGSGGGGMGEKAVSDQPSLSKLKMEIQ